MVVCSVFEFFRKCTACLYGSDGVAKLLGMLECMFMGYFHAGGASVECSKFDFFSEVCSRSHAAEGNVGGGEEFFCVGDDVCDILWLWWWYLGEGGFFCGSENNHDEDAGSTVVFDDGKGVVFAGELSMVKANADVGDDMLHTCVLEILECGCIGMWCCGETKYILYGCLGSDDFE